MNKFELLQKAYKQNLDGVTFDFPLPDGKKIKMKMIRPSPFEVGDLQRIESEKLALEFDDQDKLKKAPVDEKEWQTYISDLNEERKKRVESRKPKNRLEQILLTRQNRTLVVKVIPRYILDPDTDERIFPDQKSLAIFCRILEENPNLMSLLAEQYLKLVEQTAKVEEAAKNS